MFLYDLYEDVTDEQRVEIVALESAEIALDRAVTAYDVIMEARDMQLREAELKCFAESGDVNVLMDFYEDAKESTEEKKKGVLATIWEKIINFINKILGREVKKEEDEKYLVSSNMPKAIQAVKNAITSITQFITNPIKAIFTKGEATWKKMVGILEAIGISAVVIVGGKAMIKAAKGKGGKTESTGESIIEMNGKEINTEVSVIKNMLEKIKKPMDQNKDKIGENVGSDNEGIVGKICSAITKKANEIISLLVNAVKAGGSKVKNAVTKVKGAATKVADTADDAAIAVGESGDDFVMTKDFADILSAQPYEEACDTSELEEMLAGLI